ncbi:MAG TPA: LytTR family DNA-binding domain-containing protein [Gemmatimonadaceae bacterium]
MTIAQRAQARQATGGHPGPIMEKDAVSSVDALPVEPNTTLTALVVDDEAIARDGLGHILTSLGGIEVLIGCRNGREAIRAIRARRPDVVFLDVEMPDVNGIDVVRSLQEDTPADQLPIFVFVTAYSAYAIEAFNLAASDYLVKPFTDARIARCMARVRRLHARMHAERLSQAVISLARNGLAAAMPAPASHKAYIQRILIPHGVRTVVVPVNTVDWIGADNDYIVVHSQGKTHLLRGTLGAIEQDLDPQCFVRAHRSILVNIEQIAELRRDRDGSAALILRDGTRLPVGRRRYDEIRDRLASNVVPRVNGGNEH